jgi:hypothetical protein
VRVFCVQHNDGVQSGEENEVPPQSDGETPSQILRRKAASHEAHGWTVDWTGEDGFHAHKCYDLPGYPGRKDRFFRVGE